MPTHPEARVTYLVGRLDRVVRRRLEEVLLPYGLTLAQYTALSVLASRPGLTNAQLARRSLVTPQGMNQALAVLADKGWIRRKRVKRGRQLAIHLTAKGKSLLERCRPATEAVEEELLGPLPADDRERLLGYLQTLTELGVARAAGAGDGDGDGTEPGDGTDPGGGTGTAAATDTAADTETAASR